MCSLNIIIISSRTIYNRRSQIRKVFSEKKETVRILHIIIHDFSGRCALEPYTTTTTTKTQRSGETTAGLLRARVMISGLWYDYETILF